MNTLKEKFKSLFSTKHKTGMTIGAASVVLVAAIIVTVVLCTKKPVKYKVDKTGADTSSVNVTVPDIKSEKDSSDTASKSSLNIDVAGSEASVDQQNVQATPSTAQPDPIVVNVTGITLSTTNVTLTVGKSQMPIVTMIPSNATDKGEIWESSNTAVATVNSSGKIIAKAVGTCVITVKAASNQSILATVNVTVTAPQTVTQTPITSTQPNPTQPNPTQPTTPTPQPTTPSVPEGIDPATAGATGKICPWCGKEIWNSSKYGPATGDKPNENYCYGLEGLQIG